MNRNNWRAFGVVSALCLITLPVPLVHGDWSSAAVLGLAAALTAIMALVPRLQGSNEQIERSEVERLAEIAVSWTIVGVSAAVLTWILAHTTAPATALTDATSSLFEATSGVTTTGLTMLASPSSTDPTLLWWRTATQWVGGIGVIVFALVVAERSGDDDSALESAWGSLPANRQSTKAARLIIGLYSGITAAVMLGLMATGDSPWTAVNHAATTAATGGFSTADESVAASSGPAQAVVAVGCILSAISYGTLWTLPRDGGPVFWRRTQLRWGAGLLGGGAIAAMVAAVSSGQPLGATVFNAISASTTAGFAVGDGHRTVAAITTVTIFSMFIGGAGGSTAGGLKVARVVWLIKAAARWLPQGGRPFAEPYIWDDREVEPTEATKRVTGALALAALWLIASVIGTFLLAVTTNASVGTAAFEAVSALSGVGLSSGLTGAELAATPKLVLSALMLIGRVEITAFLALIIPVAVHSPD